MTVRPSPQQLLRLAQKLLTLSSPDEILAASCREVLALTGAERAFSACCLPGQSWEHGVHIEADPATARRMSPAARSAMFAIHRRLAAGRAACTIERSGETAAIFAGLACGPHVVAVQAVPVVHRTGRLWGELVLVGADATDPTTNGVSELAQLATTALENAQRLAFARRDQDRLLLLAEATDDALYDWNFDSRDFWWGGGTDEMFGVDADPVQHSPAWKQGWIHPDDAGRVQASLDEARAGKTSTWKAEYRICRKDGSCIQVEERGYFLRDASGRAYRMIGSMRDVTARNDLLAREQQVRAEAERANRAKDEFLAMLGHELRNPLAPIITGLQLMRLRGTARVEKELTAIERQAQHLIRLVDDLLDISRIAHAKIELKKERLEVAAAIAAAIETASPLLEARMHVLEVEVPVCGLEVLADRARLAQAISNLLNNAAKYTEPGGRITVRAQRDGDDVTIAIRDTGMGIAPEMLPSIFGMFVQERQALDRSQGGLGLGLSIVRSLIELHGGTVVPRSEGRGQGSEFTIRIPAASPAVTAEVAPALPRRLEPQATGRRIMVVDDNEDAADLLSTLLEGLGNTTRIAHDAHAALQLVDDFAPDLAVLDIGLPVMDGYELARRLRSRPGAKPMHLVALTGYGQESDRQQAIRAGFDAHLVKPIAIDALEAVIAQLLTAPA